MVKFQKFYVTDGAVKARVFYSLDNRCDGRNCVTLYARDYGGQLGKVLAAEYVNDTDSQSDYFDQGRANLFEGNPLYAAARARAEQNKIENDARYAAKETVRVAKMSARQASASLDDFNYVGSPMHY